MKPHDISVRPATPADVPQLVALNAQVQELHVRAEPDIYRPTDSAEVEALFRARLSAPEVVVFVANADPLLGYIVTQHLRLPRTPFVLARERLLVEEIAVVASRRRLGVGRALMASAEQRARELGLRHVFLDVRAFNGEAQRFYQALGYVPAQLRVERRW